jgi:hypothetical protein
MVIVIAAIVFFLGGGWSAVVALAAGRLFGFLVSQAIEIARVRSIMRAAGQPLTASEVDFLNAYRLHAIALGLGTDIELEPEESHPSNWSELFEDYVTRNPQIAQLMLR